MFSGPGGPAPDKAGMHSTSLETVRGQGTCEHPE